MTPKEKEQMDRIKNNAEVMNYNRKHIKDLEHSERKRKESLKMYYNGLDGAKPGTH
jgi:hypothetical protein